MTDTDLGRLRVRPDNRNLLWGFGPLLVGLLLFLLMVFLAPTVAPERIVERPTATQAPAP